MNYKRAFEEAIAHLETIAQGGMTAQQQAELANKGIERTKKCLELVGTPSSMHSVLGDKDDFADLLNQERSDLVMGSMTDDELANYAFLHYDQRPDLQHILAGTAHSPIKIMTGVKERIRWLSRKLEEAQTQIATLVQTK